MRYPHLAAWSALCLFVLFCLGGCSSKSLLPSAKDVVLSPWESFAEVKEAFDQIVPYQTDIDTLTQLRFTPETSPNIQILNHLEVMQRFLPHQSLTVKDLDPGLQDCLSQPEQCQGFEVNLRRIHSKRYGSVWLDLFNFRRRTSITGWEFKAIIVMKDRLAVYKICGGKPKIDEDQDRKNPLGPLQSLEGVDGVMWSAAGR